MLELNPTAAYVVGVKLARDQITIVVTNFRADVLTRCRCRSASTGSRPRSPPIWSRTASGAAVADAGLR